MIENSIEFKGAVEWFGENPSIVLKSGPDGPIVTIGHFFRVLSSPHGAGIVAIVMQAPTPGANDDPESNVCLTDNRPLAEYIIKNYAAKFGSFRGTDVETRLTFKEITSATVRNAAPKEYAEIIEADGTRVEFVWKGMLEPFAAAYPPPDSGIPGQLMVSTYVPTTDGVLLVNGKQCVGELFEKETLGHKHTSAELAFAETWVRVS
ncbi:MAG: hypothetical protein AAF224_12635 [Pseudomonadota bacterium]